MQEKFVLEGLVHPVRAKFTIQGEKNLWQTWDDGEKYFIDIKVIEGQITLNVTIDNRKGNIWDIKNIITTLVQTQLDATGFDVNKYNHTHVLSLDLEVHSITDLQTNEKTSLGDKEHLFHKGEAPELPPRFSSLAAENKPLARALSNFRQAIRYPDETAFFCRRAVEAVASDFRESKDPLQKIGKAWAVFDDALHLDSELKERLKAHEVIRHGRMIAQNWSQRHEQLLIAWQIIYRFVHFLDRDKVPLCKTEFPLFSAKE